MLSHTWQEEGELLIGIVRAGTTSANFPTLNCTQNRVCMLVKVKVYNIFPEARWITGPIQYCVLRCQATNKFDTEKIFSSCLRVIRWDVVEGIRNKDHSLDTD